MATAQIGTLHEYNSSAYCIPWKQLMLERQVPFYATLPSRIYLHRRTKITRRNTSNLTIVEQYHFHRRDQAAGETISEYDATLRKLATHQDYLEQALRDRFVCGIQRNTLSFAIWERTQGTWTSEV